MTPCLTLQHLLCETPFSDKVSRFGGKVKRAVGKAAQITDIIDGLYGGMGGAVNQAWKAANPSEFSRDTTTMSRSGNQPNTPTTKAPRANIEMELF
jgi:hypothetical protein